MPGEIEDLKQKLPTHDPFLYEPSSLPTDKIHVSYFGKLNTNRLSSNKPCDAPGPKSEKAKKIFVIRDSSLKAFDNKDLFADEYFSYKTKAISPAHEMARASILFIETLISVGYRVRFWDGEKTIQINNRRDIKNNIKLIKAGRKETVLKKLAEENIGKDAFYDLDYFGFRNLKQDPIIGSFFPNLNSGLKEKNVLYVEDLPPAQAVQDLPADIFDWLNDNQFSLAINGDPFEKSEVIKDKLAADFKKFELLIESFSEKIKAVYLDRIDEDPWLLKKILMVKRLEKIIWYGANSDIGVRASKLGRFLKEGKGFGKTNLKSLIIENFAMPVEIFSQLIENSEQLIELDIRRCVNLDEGNIFKNELIQNQKKPLGKLQILKISSTNIKREDLVKLASFAASSLRVLSLYQTPVLEEQEASNSSATAFAEHIVFPYLKEVSFEHFKNSNGFAESIIMASPSVELLQLIKCKEIHNLNFKKSQRLSIFSKLKCLKIVNEKTSEGSLSSNAQISFESIGKILVLGQKSLQEIYFRRLIDEGNFHDYYVQNEISFPEMKILNVFGDDHRYFGREFKDLEIPLGTYLKMISLSPKLKKINLEYVLNLDKEWHINSLVNIRKINLKSITHIIVNNSKISGSILGKILCQAVNVEELNFSKCSNLDDLKPEHIPNDIVFKKLIRISGDHSNIPGDVLAKIIARSPSLEKVSVKDPIESSLATFNLSKQKYTFLATKLQHCNLQAGSISVKEIIWIAHNSMIDCFDFHEMNLADFEKINLGTKKFEKIKILKIFNTPFAGKALSKLLPLLPNLESIISTVETPYPAALGPIEKKNLISERHIPNGLKLPKLKIVNLAALLITGKAVARIITASPEIERLDFSYCITLNDLTFNLISHGSFEKLLEIKEEDSNIPFDTFLKLSTKIKLFENNRTNAEQIIINSFSSKLDQNVRLSLMPASSFPTVKKIELNHYYGITQRFFGDLIISTPNLKDLILKHLNFSDFSFERLFKKPLLFTSLEVNLVKISRANLQYLIETAFQLKKLVLSYKFVFDPKSQPVPDVSDSKELKVSSGRFLEEIVIKGDKSELLPPISESFLYQLISNAKNLVKLELNSFYFKEEEESRYNSLAYYEKLEEINFENSTIPYGLYIQLLQKSPKLKKIRIKGCEFTAQTFDENYQTVELKDDQWRNLENIPLANHFQV